MTMNREGAERSLPSKLSPQLRSAACSALKVLSAGWGAGRTGYAPVPNQEKRDRKNNGKENLIEHLRHVEIIPLSDVCESNDDAWGRLQLQAKAVPLT
ncbi:hypothetical protein [Methylobacterium oxalidis]|uniref:hypothetical protein n=1 Tax=Methylobacterium oxalidis TaxID=944322 RepID=UPI0011BE84A4|nr:hypothetical protein [Methylobacterium oxalidis]